MDKGDIITLAQIGILALIVYSVQIIFEFIESLLGTSGNWSYVVLIINPIVAVIIITAICAFWTQKSMPNIVRTYSIVLYIGINFVWSNVNNAFDLQKSNGSIFPWIYLSLVLSIIIYTVMYFILTSTIDLISKIVLGKSNKKDEIHMKRISVKAPEPIPKIEIYKDELPKIATKKATPKKIVAKKKSVKKKKAKKKKKENNKFY